MRLKEQFGSSSCFIPPSGSSSTFAIKHYSGEVCVLCDVCCVMSVLCDKCVVCVMCVVTVV